MLPPSRACEDDHGGGGGGGGDGDLMMTGPLLSAWFCHGHFMGYFISSLLSPVMLSLSPFYRYGT